MVLVALCERESAKSGVAYMQRDRGEKEWTMRHAFFADMGGFKLPKSHGGTRFHTGLEFYQWFDDKRPKLEYEEIERDIRDRSKKDTLLKVFTCFQAAWFVIQTLERFSQHQPVSTLEVTTCSYIICAIITQLCWLRKPYGVNKSHSVPFEEENVELERSASQSNEAPAMNRVSESTRTTPSEDMEKQTASASDLPRQLFDDAPCTPFNRAYQVPRRSVLTSCLCACLVGVIVGVVHIIPFWNTRFVNTEGQWMWRACCGVQISVFFAFAFGAVIEPWFHGVILWVSLLFLCLLYCMSRIVLFALIWTSFSSQPVGLYQNVHWGFGLFPHWD